MKRIFQYRCPVHGIVQEIDDDPGVPLGMGCWLVSIRSGESTVCDEPLTVFVDEFEPKEREKLRRKWENAGNQLQAAERRLRKAQARLGRTENDYYSSIRPRAL